MRVSFIMNNNNITVNLNSYVRVKRAKLTKFRMIPDNLNTNMICLQIDGLSENQIISNTVTSGYFFMIPFVNNNNVPFYSNDIVDTWDYSPQSEVILNKFVIRITNELGQLLTTNNSSTVIELLLE